MDNPIRTIKQEQGWISDEFAIACDVSISTIEHLLSAEQKSLPHSVLSTLEVLGYNKNDLKEDYRDYREYKRRELLQS